MRFSDEHFGLWPVVLLSNFTAAVRLRANWPTWWRKQTSRKLPVRDNLLIFLAPQRKVLKWSLPSGVEMMWKRTCPSEDPDKTHTVLCKPTDTAYPMKKLSAICDKKTLCVVNASETFFEKTMCPKVAKYLNLVYDCRVMSGMGAKWDYYTNGWWKEEWNRYPVRITVRLDLSKPKKEAMKRSP